MRSDLEDRLFEEFPDLFCRRLNSKSPLFYGIKTRDGWFNLIRSLCRIIQSHVNSQVVNDRKIIKSSDNNLVEISCEELDNLKFFVQPEIIEIRETMGGLRFYLSGGNSYIFGAITFAEDLSFEICEFCGSPGKNQPIDRFFITICPVCKEREYEGKSKLAE